MENRQPETLTHPKREMDSSNTGELPKAAVVQKEASLSFREADG